MLHVFKKGGAWKTRQGEEYTIKAVQAHEFHDYLADGWFSCLEDCFALVSEDEYEKELRDQIKALGGKAAGRSSIETLEKQLEELQNDN
jgi:hypothetical protein